MDWQVISAVASVVSALAIVAGTLFVVFQLRQEAKDRDFAVGTSLFEIWQSRDFQEEQLFLLHKLPIKTWSELVALGRGHEIERALRRVGGFYDRVGHLIISRIIDQDHILPAIGADALVVWQKIWPLVEEARRFENPTLFQSFEAVLPNCVDCVRPLSPLNFESKAGSAQNRPSFDGVERISPQELKPLIEQNAVAVLDVGKTARSERVKGAIRAEPNDLAGWLRALPPNKPVVTYCA
jgi:hypothetical protein